MRILRNKNAPPTADLVQTFIDTAYDNVKLVSDNLATVVAVGEAILAGDLNNFLTAEQIDTLAELNTIVTDATLGDAGDFATSAQGALADSAIQGPIATQGEAEAGIENTKAMTPLRVAQAIAVLASGGLQNKYDGTVSPGVTDDVNAGYSVGSYWIDIVASPQESYRCVDSSAGAAVWILTTLTADELATVAVSGDSDDLTEGSVKLLMTTSERAKLTGIETGAKDDQTGPEIKALYEAQANTNAFTDTEQTRLAGMEAGATADQSNAEIEAAYNAIVAQVSAGEKTAGTETAIRRFSPKDIKDMAATHGGGGSPLTTKGDLYTYDTGDQRLGIGTNGYVLTADSAEATGMKWAAAGGAPEGTAVLSTGEAGGSKFLREDGDGTCSWQAIPGGGDALTGSPLSQFAATTSAQLAGVISDETGSGALVFATSPTLVTPALGTPSSGVATNLTGTAAGLTAGNVTTNANLTGPVTSVGNATAIADKALAIAKLADGTDGELITWGATGVIETIAVGTATHVLTSNGAGLAPTFQAVAGGGSDFTTTYEDLTYHNYGIGTLVFQDVTVGPTAIRNIALGTDCLKELTAGSYNIAIGHSCIGGLAAAPTTGSSNIGIGDGAGPVIQGGDDNILVGDTNGLGIISDHGNVAVGAYALSGASAPGEANIAIGYGAGEDITGGAGYNIVIGNKYHSVDPVLLPVSSDSGQINIGNTIKGYMQAPTNTDDRASKTLVITGPSAKTDAVTYQNGGDLILRGGQKASGGGTSGNVEIIAPLLQDKADISKEIAWDITGLTTATTRTITMPDRDVDLTGSEVQRTETGTTYTLVASDNGKTLYFTNSAAVAVTVPNGLPVGFQCMIKQTTAAGIPTCTPNTDTINGAGTGVAPDSQWKGLHLAKYASTSWFATY